VVDGSIVRESGRTGSQWRLHYAIGLPSLQCQEVHVTSSDEGESLKRFEVQAGDIFMADRGYAHPGGVSHVKRHGGDVIVRMNLVTLALTDPETGAPLDALAKVRSLQVGQCGAWPVRLKVKAERGGQRAHEIQGRLCAVRKSAASAALGRDRVRHESKRGGCKVQPQTLEAAEFPHLREQTRFLVRYAEDVLDGAYACSDLQAIAETVFALGYLLKDVDIIPDTVPGKGLADDSLVLRAVLSSHEEELRAFAAKSGLDFEKVSTGA
jgi:uncharacterized membrane protein YkvA (DUF1232 family)